MVMIKVLRLSIFVACISLNSIAVFAGDKTITLAIISDLPIVEPFKKHIIRAYNSIDHQVKFKAMSPNKAFETFEQAGVDGLTIRLSEVESKTNKLVRVPVRLASGHLVLYCNDSKPCSNTVLNDKNVTIGYLEGMVAANRYMQNKSSTLYPVKNVSSLGAMLASKRLNYILSLSLDNLGELVTLDEKKLNRVILKEIEAFHYIHKNKSNLLPLITRSMQNTVNKIGLPKKEN